MVERYELNMELNHYVENLRTILRTKNQCTIVIRFLKLIPMDGWINL